MLKVEFCQTSEMKYKNVIEKVFLKVYKADDTFVVPGIQQSVHSDHPLCLQTYFVSV